MANHKGKHSVMHIRDDVIGRIRNTRLDKRNALLPLFEAVVNSLHALEHRKSGGVINIEILREKDNLELGDDVLLPICGFKVTDNGIGFDEQNFESFCTADSRFKESKGGKGVGRFMWLLAFGGVDVQSVYSGGTNKVERVFEFRAEEQPIRNHAVYEVDAESTGAIVRLLDLKKGFRDYIPSSAHALAERLVGHFLVWLSADSCPQISVSDPAGEAFVSVNRVYKEDMLIASDEYNLKVADRGFLLTYIKISSGSRASHKIVLTADNREVVSYPLNKYVPDLGTQRIDDDEGAAYELWVLVSSPYLKEIINPERTSFMFADSDAIGQSDGLDLSQTQVLDDIATHVTTTLESYISSVQEEKLKRIEDFIQEEEPEYRVLLKYARADLMKIPANVTDHKLDLELHKLKHRIERDLKEEGKSLLTETDDRVLSSDEYQSRYGEYVDKLLDYRSSELAKYVIHRRTIIDLLDRAISLKSDGRPDLEEQVHQLIYPMKKESDDVEFGYQNLWLIDEKLTYHFFLASDTELSKMSAVESESRNRPDILVFNRPSAFAEGDFPFQSVVVIELKRPEKSSYKSDESDDPSDQVYRYIDDLIAGKVYNEVGQAVQLPNNVRFYCYILADLTPRLKTIAKRKEFQPTPDGAGYFKFSQNYNAYVEIISYQKLLADAKKRNRVLFARLGLPGYHDT